jgi:hypothetical protein
MARFRLFYLEITHDRYGREPRHFGVLQTVSDERLRSASTISAMKRPHPPS